MAGKIFVNEFAAVAAKFRPAMYAALRVADFYDGSEEKLAELAELLAEAERHARKLSAGMLDEDIERALSRHNQLDELTIGAAWLQAATSFNHRLQGASDMAQLLELLRQGGAFIDDSPAVFVPTTARRGLVPGPEPATRYAPVFQPRLAWLVEGLRDFGVYTDDLIIRPGKLAPNMLRQRPYMLVEIPRLGRQILVCDQLGERTFISKRMLSPAFYQQHNKIQLRVAPDITGIIFTAREKWLATLVARLNATATPAAKIKPALFAQKPHYQKPHLSEQLVLIAAKEFYAQHQKWPPYHSPEPVPGMPDETWISLDAALSKGTRGLPGGSSLADLLERHGLKEKQKHNTSLLTEEMIVNAALEFYALHRHYPTKRSTEPVPGMPDETWKNLDTALYQGLRNLPGGSSLADMLHRHGLKRNKLASTAFVPQPWAAPARPAAPAAAADAPALIH